MKTYWLEGRESRPSLTKVISPQLQPGTELEWERAADVRDSIAEHSAAQLNSKEQHSGNFQHLPNSTVSSGPNSLLNNSGILNPTTVSNKSPQGQRSVTPAPPVPTMTSPAEERRIYSPVTFQDVARRSIVNSPNRTEKDKGHF
jgi:guanylate cyclase, other